MYPTDGKFSTISCDNLRTKRTNFQNVIDVMYTHSDTKNPTIHIKPQNSLFPSRMFIEIHHLTESNINTYEYYLDFNVDTLSYELSKKFSFVENETYSITIGTTYSLVNVDKLSLTF